MKKSGDETKPSKEPTTTTTTNRPKHSKKPSLAEHIKSKDLFFGGRADFRSKSSPSLNLLIPNENLCQIPNEIGLLKTSPSLEKLTEQMSSKLNVKSRFILKKGDSIEAVLPIQFEDATLGCKKKIAYKRKLLCSTCNATCCSICGGTGIKLGESLTDIYNPCPSCCIPCCGSGVVLQDSSIEITIPQGALNGHTIIIPNKGDEGTNRINGDFTVVLKYLDNPNYLRNGNDCTINLEIPITTLVLGGKLSFSCLLDKNPIEITIPKLFSIHTIFEIKCKGFFNPYNPKDRGNLYIKFEIASPTLNPKELQLLTELSEQEHFSLKQNPPTLTSFYK